MMKKTVAALLAAVLAFCCLASCGRAGQPERDLTAFWDRLASEYDMPEMMEITDDVLDSYYPGLREVALKQRVVRVPEISAAPGEYVFVECGDGADAEKVSAILQSRIDTQAGGGAWYPSSVEAWGLARVAVNGAYVAMIAAGEDTEAIVSEFNALFGKG